MHAGVRGGVTPAERVLHGPRGMPNGAAGALWRYAQSARGMQMLDWVLAEAAELARLDPAASADRKLPLSCLDHGERRSWAVLRGPITAPR